MAFVEDNAFKHTYVSSQTPVIMLSTKSHEILGCIGNYDKDSININFNMNSANEISFDVYKEVDGVVEPLWDQIIDFKYIYFKQTDEFGNNAYEEFFNITLAVDDGNDIVKHVTGTSACEFELSKRMLYGFEINTETDYKAQETKGEIPKGADYIPTIFYNADNQKYSLLHRVLNDKNAAVGDYELKYVSPSLCNIQRKYTADGQSVYDFLTGTVAKETECLFAFDSVERGIYVYDLKFVCGQCGKRGDPAAVCPHCGSADFHSVFGESTNLFISASNYADSISRSAKTDNVFNCLRISGGDDIMNTALMYVNPNGSRYVYSYNEDMLNDMPEVLRTRIAEYNVLYDSLKATYASYSEDYYDAIDEKYKLAHSMMPEVTTPTTTAEEQATNLPASFASFGKVYVSDLPNITNTSANLAVQGVGAVLCDSRYKVTASGTVTQYTTGSSTVTWTGTLYVENYGRSEDNATTTSFSVTIGNGAADSTGYAGFLEQRILKKLDRDNSTFFDIFSIEDDNTFKTELTKYGLASLKSFYQSYDTCLSVLQEMGDSTPESDIDKLDPKPYATMYLPYFNRKGWVEAEMKVRETQLYGNGGSEEHPTGGVQGEIERLEKLIAGIHEQLNFANYLNADGRNLYPVYTHYRMESSYTNANYVSTGLETPQLLKDAQELFEVGLQEVYKARQLQYTLNCSLNDLLLDNYESSTLETEDEDYGTREWSFNRFKNYADKFQIGNWLNLQSDDKAFYLRLLSLSVDYGSLENINVTFSEALQVNGIISDAKSILDQAKSMASSYDGVAHQASKGEEANNSVEDWMINGLNAALTTLKNSNSEEITFDNNGLLGRSYDDITDSYDNRQVKLTSKVLAFTDDNWKTAKLALGNSLYAKYDEQQDRLTTNNPGYGLLAEYINGSYITGSQIVGGDLYSLNYSAGNHTGSHIDLNTGYFSLAGGNIAYDGTKLTIKLGDTDIDDALLSITYQYIQTTSDTTPPSQDDPHWSTTMPTREDNKYIWQRTIETYIGGGTPTITTPVCISSLDGQDGRGIDHVDIKYGISDSSSTLPTSWSVTIPSSISPGDYLWTWTRTIYTSGSPDDSYTYSYQGENGHDGQQGPQGDTGPKGDDGDPGRGVASVTIQYGLSANRSTAPTTWSDNVPQYNAATPIYWRKEVTSYDNGDPSTTVIIVDNGLTDANKVSHDAEVKVDAANGQIVLKASTQQGTGSNKITKLATIALSSNIDDLDPTSSSFVTIGADVLNLSASEAINLMSNGSINLTAHNITFDTGANGSFTATSGEIGGWEIGSTYIKTKNVALTSTADNSVGLSSSTFTREINTISRDNLKFAIGGNFGVQKDGTLYASNADVSGKITASSGKIGGWDIKQFTNTSGNLEGAIYYNTDSMDSTTVGTYIGTDGIKQYRASNNYLTIQGAQIESYKNSSNYLTISGAEFKSAVSSTNYLTITGAALESHYSKNGNDAYLRIANEAIRMIGGGAIRVGNVSTDVPIALEFSRGDHAYTSIPNGAILQIPNANRLRFTNTSANDMQNQYVVYATNTGGQPTDADGRYLSTLNSITLSELQCLSGISVNVASKLTSLQAQIDSLDPSSATVTANKMLISNSNGKITAGTASSSILNVNSSTGLYTASRVLISDSNGKISTSDFNSTLFAVCAPHATHGATNNLFNERGRVLLSADSSYGTTNNGRIVTSDITIAELDCLDGVSSNIQTQLNGKASSSTVSTLSSNLSSLTTTVNNLNYSDVGAVPTSRKINGYSLTQDRTLTADDVGAISSGDRAFSATKVLVTNADGKVREANYVASTELIRGNTSYLSQNKFSSTYYSKVLISDSSGLIATGDCPSGKLTYLKNVSSDIQNQLDSKISSTNGAISTVVSSNLSANYVLISDGNGKIAASSTISTTELGYLNNVSSNIQTQLNGKLSSSALDDSGTIYESVRTSSRGITTSAFNAGYVSSVPAGTYVVTAMMILNSSYTSTFGLGISTTSADSSAPSQVSVSGTNIVNVSKKITLSSSSSIYAVGKGGTALSSNGILPGSFIRAIRVK